ncbi:hypothetical protein [Streptomyces albidocamelliae]|uniref:Triphosphoribosyl-dephospho-CoA synthase n=1 Tax=Streptomyces albidocamelliae TaxID=2981135 RepID=A0ABY6F0Z1_9ACTN|nr:hypothetical protein [Streptomyces sp. HUAS 14-6]UXY40355.1 hypothetical protein N8I86_33965 [Streptomyces sp. HUAS 14-6]
MQQRIAPDGNVTGYSVALPGDRHGAQQPVWFSGSKLAPDLSLPRVRERWQQAPGTAAASAMAWRVAEEKVRAAAEQLGAGGLQQGAGDVAALGDLIVVAAVLSPRLVRYQMRQAATEFERAGRAPAARDLEGRARELYRESTQALSRAAASAGRSDTTAALGFLLALVGDGARNSPRMGHRAGAGHSHSGSGLRVRSECALRYGLHGEAPCPRLALGAGGSAATDGTASGRESAPLARTWQVQFQRAAA